MKFLHASVRDGYAVVLNKLNYLVTSMFEKLLDPVVDQILWLCDQFMENNVNNLELLLTSLLRRIKSTNVRCRFYIDDSKLFILVGDYGEVHVNFILKLIHLFGNNQTTKNWVKARRQTFVPLLFYALMKLMAPAKLLQQATIVATANDFLSFLCNEFFQDILQNGGRDVLRIMTDCSKESRLGKAWNSRISDEFYTGSSFSLYAGPSTPALLAVRLTPEMASFLTFICHQVKLQDRIPYYKLFQRKFLSVVGSECIIPDLIRYICGSIAFPKDPSFTQRYAVIGWLLSTIKSPFVKQMSVTALYCDWIYSYPTEPLDDAIAAERSSVTTPPVVLQPGLAVLVYSANKNPVFVSDLVQGIYELVMSPPASNLDNFKASLLSVFLAFPHTLIEFKNMLQIQALSDVTKSKLRTIASYLLERLKEPSPSPSTTLLPEAGNEEAPNGLKKLKANKPIQPSHNLPESTSPTEILSTECADKDSNLLSISDNFLQNIYDNILDKKFLARVFKNKSEPSLLKAFWTDLLDILTSWLDRSNRPIESPEPTAKKHISSTDDYLKLLDDEMVLVSKNAPSSKRTIPLYSEQELASFCNMLMITIPFFKAAMVFYLLRVKDPLFISFYFDTCFSSDDFYGALRILLKFEQDVSRDLIISLPTLQQFCPSLLLTSDFTCLLFSELTPSLYLLLEQVASCYDLRLLPFSDPSMMSSLIHVSLDWDAFQQIFLWKFILYHYNYQFLHACESTTSAQSHVLKWVFDFLISDAEFAKVSCYSPSNSKHFITTTRLSTAISGLATFVCSLNYGKEFIEEFLAAANNATSRPQDWSAEVCRPGSTIPLAVEYVISCIFEKCALEKDSESLEICSSYTLPSLLEAHAIFFPTSRLKSFLPS